MNPNYFKKGVFTSHNLTNPSKKENIIINDPSEQYHHRHQFQVVHNKNNLTVEQLQGARFSQSIGYSIERPEMHFKYVNGSQQQTFVPPPPQRFLVSSGQSYSQPSTLPIHSGPVQSVHTVQPLYQSIKRTYVPHHIINQIPIMDSQTKYYQENHEVRQQEQIGIDENDRKMIEQYQKLYDTYQLSQMKVEQLQRQLREQREKKQSNGSEVRQVLVTKEVFVEKPKKVDIKLLSSLIIKKNKAVIDEIVERKKNSCINKLRALFSEEQSTLKTTLLRASEQFTSKRVRTR